MKGEVIISFVAQLEGRKVRGVRGDIIDIPPNVDWVTAGFVSPIVEEDAPKPTKRKKDSA